MKSIIKIYDFIRSWLYYPTLRKYFTKNIYDLYGIKFKEKYNTRWKYALWHCKIGKTQNMGYEYTQPKSENILPDGWKCVYRNEPIERN